MIQKGKEIGQINRIGWDRINGDSTENKYIYIYIYRQIERQIDSFIDRFAAIIEFAARAIVAVVLLLLLLIVFSTTIRSYEFH